VRLLIGRFPHLRIPEMRRAAYLRILSLVSACHSCALLCCGQSSTLSLSKTAQAQLEESAGRVAKRIQGAQILLNRPGVVVLDFANLDDNKRSTLGITLSDRFSDTLERYASKFKVIPRSTLQDFLRNYWLDSEETRNQEVAKWLGDQLHAIDVIQGTIELLSDGQVKLRVRVIGISPVHVTESRLAASPNFRDLFKQIAPAIVPEAQKADEESGVYNFGDPGIVMPDGACIHCPNPDYNNPARAAKYQGSVRLSAILGTDGTLSAIKVVKYAPFGLTDLAIESVRTWRMKPCEKDGKPVAARVPIEIIWRLF